ncbi:MAG: L-2-hydroxyglutarate oxidase [Planctomycetota bacterium]|jgi:L-2-hydroxyglutarate oxidase LhgO
MKRNSGFDIAVVGGGIVGLASAYKITLAHPDISIAVLEKEDRVAAHQTGRNSGVIHSGLYYQPGSNKARTCAAGRRELLTFAKRYRIPYDICGKVVVATDQRQRPTLEKILQNGIENEIEGLEEIGPDRIKEIEPACEGVAAIRVPSAGIIDFAVVAEKLADLVAKKGKGNSVLTSHEVTGLDRHDFYTEVRTTQGPIAARYIINCAGLQCDRVAKMDNVEPDMKVVPFRGDYYELTEEAQDRIENLIYPVPDPALPFLGVHFTRMIGGGVECGPNAVFSFKREGYGKTDFSLGDALDALSYPGLWRMFLKYWKVGLAEYARAFSKKLFLRQLQRLVPSLTDSDIRPCRSGVRAQALERNGRLIDDFRIERQANSIHVLNAPSPAATASLAIGDHVNEMATRYFKL